MHYAIMVVGKNINEQLKPFSENLEVDEYVTHIVTEEDKKEIIEYYKEKGVYIDGEPFESLYERVGERWNANNYRKDEDGIWREYSTRNPRGEWDWYQIGGRWAGSLLLKEGVSPNFPVNFSWGWSEEEKTEILNENRADSALKKDIKNLAEIKTYGILKDGVWLDMDSLDVERSQREVVWESEFSKIVSSIPDDSLITIVDIHS